MPSRPVPAALESPFDVGGANPVVELARGAAKLIRGNQSIDLSNLRVVVSSRPSWALRFEGTGQSTAADVMNRVLNQWTPNRVTIPLLAATGVTFEETTQLGGDFTKHPSVITAQGELRGMRAGRARRFRTALFHVANFPNFIGAPIGDGSGSWRGRLELSAGGWRILLDARRDLRNVQDALRDEGGFAVSHLASLDRGGSTFTWDEAEECLDGLHWFLPFVRGAWTSPIVVQGRPRRGAAKLDVWSVGRTDAWGGQFHWCDLTGWAAAQEAYQGYLTL